MTAQPRRFRLLASSFSAHSFSLTCFEVVYTTCTVRLECPPQAEFQTLTGAASTTIELLILLASLPSAWITQGCPEPELTGATHQSQPKQVQDVNNNSASSGMALFPPLGSGIPLTSSHRRSRDLRPARPSSAGRPGMGNLSGYQLLNAPLIYDEPFAFKVGIYHFFFQYFFRFLIYCWNSHCLEPV